MADTLDVLTLPEAQAELGDGNDDHTTSIAAWVTAVSKRLDALCGPIVIRTVTAELHDGGSNRIHLKYRPVATITSISEYVYVTGQALAAEALATKTSNDYLLDDARTGIVYRRSTGSDARFARGRRNVTVTYTAGRAATTDVVDDRFKQAARVCLKHLWRAENSIGTATFGTAPGLEAYTPLIPTFAIPRAALELVQDELLGRASEVLVK